MSATCDVVVLLSGTGSNLQALIDSTRTGDSPARIAAVISNRSDAYGLQRAREAGIATRTLDHKAFEGREAFDSALVELIDAFNPNSWYWPASCVSSALISCGTTLGGC